MSAEINPAMIARIAVCMSLRQLNCPKTVGHAGNAAEIPYVDTAIWLLSIRCHAAN